MSLPSSAALHNSRHCVGRRRNVGVQTCAPSPAAAKLRISLGRARSPGVSTVSPGADVGRGEPNQSRRRCGQMWKSRVHGTHVGQGRGGRGSIDGESPTQTRDAYERCRKGTACGCGRVCACVRVRGCVCVRVHVCRCVCGGGRMESPGREGSGCMRAQPPLWQMTLGGRESWTERSGTH